MKRRTLLFTALGLPFLAEAKHSQSLIYHWIRRIRELAANLKSTSYQHTTEIDLASGEFKCDCSGFVGFFVRKTFPESHRSLQGEEAPWRKRPLAVTFHETIVRSGREKGAGWTEVQKIFEARPGDIIAWRKDEVVRGESTGHVVFVVEKPVRELDGRYRVRVLDSTSRIHADDTRAPDGDGVGEGTMWFQVDGDFKPTGYFVDERKRLGKSTQIAIGRLEDRSVGGSLGSTTAEDLEKELDF